MSQSQSGKIREEMSETDVVKNRATAFGLRS